ncbi:hypothetical protein [Microbacterium lushaniae]|uniref:FMN-binding domain-containing protein n=1 Tax=Microbacterium lushaniae TaxID=2614639 RepID=A0A5J6L5R1_9MICO|nr:hypothetical protein [Microbacterium lushaniae]QEW03672.1 hypothetical protein F6J85_11605 [Microbacterium lushaniae]
MLHPTAVRRPIRVGAALAGVAGIVGLTGCAGSGSQENASPEEAAYTDGTYTAEGSYRTPETTETIEVTLTLADDVITAVEVAGDPQAPQSVQYQGRFIGGISDEVVGRDIDEISVSRVAGSSLTSGGFNEAIEVIKAEAAA